MKIELIRHWSISTVHRATTRRGTYYFKQSPPFFPNEVPITVAIAARFPDISPRVLARDVRRRWMLLDDLGDLTMETADPAAPEGAALWTAAAKSLARVQQTYAAAARRGNPCGCPLRRPPFDRLERRPIPQTLAAIRRWTTDHAPLEDLLHRAPQTAQALSRLAPNLPQLDVLNQDLTAANLPQTLNHGDLDAGNIFIRNSVPVLMDWSDACITNPLFDPVQIPQIADNQPISDAYLSNWTSYAPLETLRAAFRAAAPIAALERAIHYRRNIVPHIPPHSDDRPRLEAYIPELLNRAADLLQ